jgi:hypothetical protein
MYVTIRTYGTNSPEEISRLVNQTFVSVFESKGGAEQSDELAQEFYMMIA